MMNPNLGRNFTNWNESKVTPCEYVSEGEIVLAHFRGNQAVRCEVVVAAGFHARVVNTKHNFDKWLHVGDLAREK